MIKLNRKQLIEKYIKFFQSKDHKKLPNSSLIPENDPTVLFTTAGMQPLVPYLLGQKHPLGKRLCSVQRCIRTGDIKEVGDSVHLTFFEMLGNWSLGDYFKKQAIEMSFEFLTKQLKIPKEKIAVTCFKGLKEKGEKIPKDEEAAKIWQSLGIKKNKIKFLGKKDNWWGPAGKTGPCGPDTEMFYITKKGKEIEIWNDVFMQYNKIASGEYKELKQKNVDTGMGVERTIAILNNIDDIYKTEVFLPIIKQIEKLSEKSYAKSDKETKRAMRIIADHIKASVFILTEKIPPSNTEQGYVLRRLIRRSIRHGKFLEIEKNFTKQLAQEVIKIYDDYLELKNKKNKKFILNEIEKEENKFRNTLEKGLNKLKKLTSKTKKLSGKNAFLLYQSFGFPKEMIIEETKKNKIKFDEKDFDKELKKHQKLSRTATQGKFKSGLADKTKQTTKLHTATHLLLTALRSVLKDDKIEQKGSNITAERLRFDFNFPRKLTKEEIKKIEDFVNKIIKTGCSVEKQEMKKQRAIKLTKASFEHKYPDIVTVYKIGNYSEEICAGPHVKSLCELGHFKIIKEESSSAGIRRIKAILE